MLQALITSRAPKGLQIANLFDAALNKAKLNDERAQRLIENGGKFQEGLTQLMNELSAPEPVAKWTEKDGVIYLTVTSDGTSGEKWIGRLESKGFRVGDYAKSVLRSDDFKPTNGVTTKIAVLKGDLFSSENRITRKICAEAEKRKLQKPNAEVACLIRENFSDEEIEAMGLHWIVAFHEPIKDSGGNPDLLGTDRNDGGRWLCTYYDKPDRRWLHCDGFAFAVSQVSSS